MIIISDLKEERRKAWEFAFGMNQIDGDYIPSDEMKELIEKNINGEITTDEIKTILNEKYTTE